MKRPLSRRTASASYMDSGVEDLDQGYQLIDIHIEGREGQLYFIILKC